MFNHILYFVLLEMADAEGDIILFDEHLVALEDVAFPEALLEERKGLEYLQHQSLLHLDYFSHGIGGCLRVVDIGEKALEPEHITSQHRLLVDHTFIRELNDHTSLLHKEEIFSNLRVIHDPLVCIEGVLFPNLISNEM